MIFADGSGREEFDQLQEEQKHRQRVAMGTCNCFSCRKTIRELDKTAQSEPKPP